MNDQELNKRWKVLFAGTPEFAVPSLNTLFDHPQIDVVGVLTQKAKPRGRGLEVQNNPIANLAEQHNAFVISPESLKSPEVLATLRGLNADAAVVVAYGLLIPNSALSLFPHGWVNTHGSLLPRWRGASPIQHAIMAGDKTTGVTLMRIDAGMDTGPTFAQTSINISPLETTSSLSEKLSQLSARMLNEHLIPYLQGLRPLINQPSVGITSARKISRSDGLISFHRTAEEIERTVRAFALWPGTFFQWNGKEVKIISATVCDGSLSIGHVSHHDLGLAIGTQKKLLVIQKMQISGKSPVDAHAFLRGYPAILQAKLA